MRLFILPLLFSLAFSSALSAAEGPSPRELVARLYRAHASKHDPLQETKLLHKYFDPTLRDLYLRDEREAAGEVGRLEFDPLYFAQDFEIKDLNIAPAQRAEDETHVTVTFTNLGKKRRLVYVIKVTKEGWRISDIRYEEGPSLKAILERAL